MNGGQKPIKYKHLILLQDSYKQRPRASEKANT